MARNFAAGQQAHNQWLSPLRSRLLEDSRQLEVPAQRDMQHLHPSCRSPTPADDCKLLHATFSKPQFSGAQVMGYAMVGIFFLSAECCQCLVDALQRGSKSLDVHVKSAPEHDQFSRWHSRTGTST
jgi:hypothetical protein